MLLIDISLFAFMLICTLFWGSNLGWGQVLIFWAVFVGGGLLISMGLNSPGISTAFKAIVFFWFAGKAMSQ